MTLMTWWIVLKVKADEADAKKKLNELNEIKKVETNSKRLIECQKKLLSLKI